MPILLRGGTVCTVNPRWEILPQTSILIEDSRIRAVLPDASVPGDVHPEVVDCSGLVIIPGFIQTHIHLCQTLFRGLADDLQLLDWLQKRIFPMEAAHNASSTHVSALLGIAELVRSGTTTILDMGTIGHEEEIVRAVAGTGLRAFVGKAMMDINALYPGLKEPTAEAVRSTRDQAERWHNSYEGRIRYAVAPRFVLSCSDTVLREAWELVAATPGMLFHTHASENRVEIGEVRKRCGMENIEFLHHLGVLSGRSVLAHCVHVNEREYDLLEKTGTGVAHCPSSNCKLGSGTANVPGMLRRGIRVSIGADGAPCNNHLDAFHELRLASLIQKPLHGPTALPARTVFELATIGGARVLGIDDETGSIEAGKKADLVLLDLNRCWNPAMTPAADLYSSIVYSATAENVHSTMIDGRWVYRAGEFPGMDEPAIRSDAARELKALLGRI